jgi:hypothetical protein
LNQWTRFLNKRSFWSIGMVSLVWQRGRRGR